MSKRKRFVITSLVLSSGFVGINFLDDIFRFWAIGILSLLTLILFWWSLREGIGLDATLLALILPFLFTLGVGLFWFLLPATIFARVPIVALYGIGIYALALTTNIYSVSAIRTIALSRAAKSVGFVVSLLVSFLLFDAIFSLRAEPWMGTSLVFAASFPIFLQGLWVSKLGKDISYNIIYSSLLFAFGLAEIYLVLYFWPVSIVVGSLFLTIGVYSLLGLGQAQEEGRLFKQTVTEYVSLGLIVFVAMFFATRWGG